MSTIIILTAILIAYTITAIKLYKKQKDEEKYDNNSNNTSTGSNTGNWFESF